MLTNNWQGVLNNVMNQTVPGNTGKTVEGVVTTSGYGISSGLMKYSPSMVIGTGVTPAKKTDFKMEEPIDSSKYDQSVSFYCTNDYEKESASAKIVGIITNKSEETLNVTEVGYICKNGTQNYSTSHLMMHEVYTTPIVFKPGETKSITIELF